MSTQSSKHWEKWVWNIQHTRQNKWAEHISVWKFHETNEILYPISKSIMLNVQNKTIKHVTQVHKPIERHLWWESVAKWEVSFSVYQQVSVLMNEKSYLQSHLTINIYLPYLESFQNMTLLWHSRTNNMVLKHRTGDLPWILNYNITKRKQHWELQESVFS